MTLRQQQVEAVFTEMQTLDQWLVLTEDQRAAWLAWIDAGGLDFRRARACEASNRVEAGRTTPPPFGLWQKIKVFLVTLVGFFSG